MAGPTETFRGIVRTEQCDHLGHMNVQFYDAAMSDGYFHILTLIGLDREAVQRRRLGIAAIRMVLNYRRELRPGDLYSVETGFLHFDGDSVDTAHRIIRLTDGKLALTAWSTGVPIDLDLRRRTTLPEDIIAAAAPYLTDRETMGLPEA